MVNLGSCAPGWLFIRRRGPQPEHAIRPAGRHLTRIDLVAQTAVNDIARPERRAEGRVRWIDTADARDEKVRLGKLELATENDRRDRRGGIGVAHRCGHHAKAGGIAGNVRKFLRQPRHGNARVELSAVPPGCGFRREHRNDEDLRRDRRRERRFRREGGSEQRTGDNQRWHGSSSAVLLGRPSLDLGDRGVKSDRPRRWCVPPTGPVSSRSGATWPPASSATLSVLRAKRYGRLTGVGEPLLERSRDRLDRLRRRRDQVGPGWGHCRDA